MTTFAVYVVVVEDSVDADMDLAVGVELLERVRGDMTEDEAAEFLNRLVRDCA